MSEIGGPDGDWLTIMNIEVDFSSKAAKVSLRIFQLYELMSNKFVDKILLAAQRRTATDNKPRSSSHRGSAFSQI